MMPRPNTSNLIEVLNTQALTEKSSDQISLSQNPDKSGRKLVILTKSGNLKLLSRPQFLTDLAHFFTSD